MNIYDSIKQHKDFMMKFADNPYNNGVLRPGWATPTFEGFFTRMVDEPVLINQSRTIQMSSEQHNLDDLDVTIELDAQRNASTGVSTALTSNETNPSLTGKRLNAQPLQAMSKVYDNFLQENIEKDSFMTTWTNLLAEKMGSAFELWCIYADHNVSTQTGEGTGYAMTDGILAQAKAISSDNNNASNGLAHLVYQDEIGEGIMDAITRYIDQNGNLSNATCILSPEIFARLMVEIANDRETNLGDAVYQNGEVTKILGVEIKQDNNLRLVRNGYGTMKFTNKEYKANGTNVQYMRYGFIGQPNNIAVGLMKEIEVQSQYDVRDWGYTIGMRTKGDCKIHHDQDTLVIPFTLQNAPQ